MRALIRMLYRSRLGSELRSDLLRDLQAEMAPEIERRAVEAVQGLLQRTRPDRRPRTERLTESWRDLEHVRMDAKVLGSLIARQLHDAAGLDRPSYPAAPERIDLTSKLCVQADIEAEWLRYWCGQLRMRPVYHRKVWEDCFVMQALWEAGMLAPGRSGLGFAVGRERIPSILARDGIQVLATDLSAADQRSAGWQQSNEHTAGLRELHDPIMCDWDVFVRQCSFEPLDMNAISSDLDGRFDFCWSICALEHLGSIEQGLTFIENSIRCLRPGGVAVHTTEFNLSTGSETIDFHDTVLFQRSHIEALGQRLAAKGHCLKQVDFDTGTGPLDSFVDVPPFPQDPRKWDLALPDPPHLRLSTDGFAVTAIGLIVTRAA